MVYSYVCEVSPPRMRGPLATMVQLLVTVGICAGFFSCYGTALISSSLSWRLPFALHAGIAVVLSIAANLYLPHSPRWLAHRGRKEEASRVWDKLGVSNAEREKDLLQNPALNEVGPSTVPLVAANEDQLTTTTKSAQLGPLARMRSAANHLKATFSQDARKPMLLGIFLMSMQQLSGIDGVIYVCILSLPIFKAYDLAVCPYSLRTSRSCILRYVPRLWCFRHTHLRLYHPLRRIHRPLGPAVVYHLRRTRSSLLHGYYWPLVRNRQRACDLWGRKMDCHSIDLYICCGVLNE